ncbi:MAG: C40 family peptidase [Maricaulaceae bacterium]
MSVRDVDPRLTPNRGDIAADRLKGRVQAERFLAGTAYQVTAGVAAIRRTPDDDGAMDDQALHGEVFTVYEEVDGWGWGQSEADDYVGYVDMAALSAPVLPASHRVTALRTYVFSEPDLKSAPRFLISRAAQIVAGRAEGRFIEAQRAGWVFAGHLAALDAPPADDFVAVAETFLHAPYLWGGKESLGLDCSGLVQTAFAACGLACPRDADLQEAVLGEALSLSPRPALRRGDLVFWPGHVGLMVDGTQLLHANAHHMATAIEPLTQAEARIGSQVGPIRAIKRLNP